ncbi:MAG: HAD-IB family hydrolase [Rubrivivax sp.]
MSLTLFDLDGTLISGDSDLLWTRFLADHGVIGEEACADAASLGRRYAGATVVPDDYCNFHAALLGGMSKAQLLPLRQRFLAQVVRPLVPDAARALVQRHRDAGDRLLLTTATNRVVSELTAQDLGIAEHLCTELEWDGDICTGRVSGTPNLRMGKVARLRAWLDAQGLHDAELKRATFYSDSFNDLALLSMVGRPVVVDPDARLEAVALRRDWQVLRLRLPRRVALPA